MKTILTGAAFFLLIITSYCQTIEQQFQKTIDSIYNANPDVIGYIVAIEAPDRNISWTGAIGYSSKDSLHKLDPYQPVLIASNIKTYVAATILRLVEEQKIDIQQPIKELLTQKTRKLFESDGYVLDSIKVVHLLSHKSGIGNYGNDEYYKFVSENPEHRWTRNEQLERTITVSDPLCKSGMSYHYSDVNYLLLTEIIERLTDQPFYAAMRELLMYKEFGLDDTWLVTLEDKPSSCKPLAHQYFSSASWDSYKIDPSWDLYGGGGIACTMEDMAKFISNLHNQKIVKDPAVLDLIFTRIETMDSTGNNYCLGIQEYTVEGTKGFGHGGAWGTFNIYFPELNTTIALCPLEAEKRNLNGDVIAEIINLLTSKE
ncbi:class A beta-lactamase-related serine hydrolase [Ancylomarina salipaludis]|uniref:Class A beta-lactamase-related serine hydrolase n=1 Tax=Ancylomarina salipaludis TaxID=2501299 RepID=A0A4Q1JJZ1_9BACT|nr:serine hydrolase domain-containing protein [Ancylomarina salipaludis]RXQ92152.1 class A beta-lactamase-related serine hydrolase [Ancylomarina salipaludis]